MTAIDNIESHPAYIAMMGVADGSTPGCWHFVNLTTKGKRILKESAQALAAVDDSCDWEREVKRMIRDWSR